MRASKPNERQKLQARIHIGAKQRGLNDAEYRAIVAGHSRCGVISSKDLSLNELRQLARYLAPTRSEQAVSLVGRASYKQQAYIRALWQERSRTGSETALDSWLAHHWQTENLKELEREKASQIIAVLQRWEKV